MKTTASRTATADGRRRRRRPDVGLRRPLPVMPGSIFDRFSKNLVEQNEVIFDAFEIILSFFHFFCSNSEVQKFDSTSVCSECFYFFFSLPGRDFNQKSATTTLTTMLTTMTTAMTSTTMKSEQEDKSSSLWARNELEIFFSLFSYSLVF